MRAAPFHFGRLVVYGYCGEVNPAGYRKGRSVGLPVEGLPYSYTLPQWTAVPLRAKDNRIRYGDLLPGDPKDW
jgi:hypothetical protein